jgi:hypothetical protein
MVCLGKKVKGRARRCRRAVFIGHQRRCAVKPCEGLSMDDADSRTDTAHRIEHFLVFGEASFVLFGENQPAIDDDIELTRLTNGQFRGNVESTFNLGRETHGTRFVVSSVAIFDFDLHGWPPGQRMVFCSVFASSSKTNQDESGRI